MSLNDPAKSRLADPFEVVNAVRFDCKGAYKICSVAAAGQPAQTTYNGQLAGGKTLQVTMSVPLGTVGVATFETQNWPAGCVEYAAWFLGDIFCFGNALDYQAPPPANKDPANRSVTFTLDANGIVIRKSMGPAQTYDLKQYGATQFYVTLRCLKAQPGQFNYSEV